MAAVQRDSAVEPPPVEVVAAEEQVDGAARLGRRRWARAGWFTAVVRLASGGVGGHGRRWFTAAAQVVAVVTRSALRRVPTVAWAADGERRKKQPGAD